LDGQPTYTAKSGFPHADPRLAGLLVNHRVVNGIFDDLTPQRDYDGDGVDDWATPSAPWDAARNTERFLQAMPVWREHGVIAFTIGLQGGNPFRSSPPPNGLSTAALDAGAFNRDGSLRPAFMARLRRILDRARELDMVPIVNYFYVGGARRLDEAAVGDAVDNATDWLLEQGYDRLIIDLVNECDLAGFWPAQRLDQVHELHYRLKDAVQMHNNRTGHERAFFVSSSFTGGASRAARLVQLSETFLRSVDLLLPHGNGLATEEVVAAIAALRARCDALGWRLPILYNEDIQRPGDDPSADSGGDMAHFQACLEAGVSWGNLIRSHQRVPCLDWAGGSPVQREWLRTVAQLAGQPAAPSSVLRFYHRI
jgi:hypothetical protein